MFAITPLIRILPISHNDDSIFRYWAYLMKIIPGTRRAH